MKQIQLKSGTYLLVEKPASKIQIHQYAVVSIPDTGLVWLHFLDRVGMDVADCIELPPGQWEIIGLGSELTEELWKEIVPRYDGDSAWVPSYYDPDSGGNGFSYDDFENEDERAVYYTVTESGRSLLRSHGFEPNRCLIIKQK